MRRCSFVVFVVDSLFVVCCLSYIACCSLFVVGCWLVVVGRRLMAVDVWLFVSVYCWLVVRCLLLFVGCRLLVDVFVRCLAFVV